MFRFASALGLWLITGGAAPAEAPAVQRPSVQRPTAPTPAPPAEAPAPTAPTPAPNPTPAPTPNTPTPSGGPPVLPPASSGAASEPATTGPSPSPLPQPSAPATAPFGPAPVTPQPAPAPAPPPVYNPAGPTTSAPPPAPTTAAPPMAGGSTTTAPGIAWEEAPPQPAETPTPYSPPLRPVSSGIGLYILSGVTLSTALGIRITASRADGGTYGLGTFALSIFYNPLFVAGFATYGGARAVHARRAAWDDYHASPRRRRTTLPGLGWGLLGGGVAVWLASRVVLIANADNLSTQRAGTLLEAGYYASLPLTFTGIHLGAFGSSYNRRYNAYAFFERMSVAPLRMRPVRPGLGPAGEVWGLSFSGRF